MLRARGSVGLVLFWNNDLIDNLKSYNRTHIDNESTGSREWRFMVFYGEPVRSKRKRSWELLTYLQGEYDNPWFCVGDFNEVLNENEQFGGV